MKIVFENKKVTLGLATVGLIVAIIVVSSFWPFILDPSRILTSEWLSDELIITVITISVTIAMMSVAQAANAAKDKSELAKAKVEFAESMKRIDDRAALFQWIKKVLQPADRREIAEREMAKLLIPYAVYELEEPEILALTKAQKYGDRFYGPYSEASLKEVIRLKKRIAGRKFVSPNYYTSVKALGTTMTLSEQAANESKKKTLTIVVDLGTRILLTWVGASILGSLVRDLTQQGGSTAEAWMRFLSRMFAFGSSVYLGYFMGCKMNDIDAYYIRKRVEVHTMYRQDRDFKPVDESKEAFKERVMGENRALLLEDAHGKRE